MQEFGFSGAHKARERYALSGRQPFSRQPFSGAAELRSNTPFPGGSPFLGSRSPVQPSCEAIRRCRAGEFRRLRTVGTVSKRIDTPYGGFYPLGTPSSALFGIPRSDGTQAFLLRGGTEKRERQYRYHLVGRKAPFLSQLRSSR